MAGHSQFKNIMHKKGAADAKRAKIFTKLIREIITAAKSGLPDPNANPRLRAAVTMARKENMPRDKIENAIKRGSGQGADTDNFEEVRYEGYGPGGVAMIVEILTDNRNRTASDVRAAFTKCGGHLGEPGSVSFMFDHVGMITYPTATASEDAMLDAAIEAGAEDCKLEGEEHVILSGKTNLGEVRDALEKKFGAPTAARFAWVPKTTSPVGDHELAQSLYKLTEMLDDNDDVQLVYTNADVAPEILEKLAS